MMTDVSSVQAHADPQPASLALYGGPPQPPAYTNGSPPPLDTTIEEEESSTIKCICGFSDDDGNTVLCEKCDTWQHIVCYYESANHVPEVHECADCAPRAIDSKSATDKQRQRLEAHLAVGERKGRPKTTAKNPKKRPKDATGAVQPNGWPVHPSDGNYNNDRKSGSPRDQPPPNKRPKTSHRSSGSMSVISQAPALVPGSRKRGNSVMVNGHSPVKSPTNPDGPVEDFSYEFMNLYRQSEPPSPDSNSYASVGVANDISTWLSDSDALAEVSGGKTPQELFSRIEVPIHELPTPGITKQTETDSSILAHNLHPQWQLITVDTLVPEGGYIGELKGLVGLKQDYFSDPANRWDLLRHPEPFVFFHPLLPIYIDARREGTILRYARRSCIPNMHMKIFIESSNDFHFCFLATRQIEPGEELTIGWDIDSEVHKQLAKVVTNSTKEGFRKIQPWASCVLANFGGCACDTSTGHQCLLEHARRNTVVEPQKTKGKKTKKLQVSPLSTGHATNSRAGSEILNRDVGDDDQMDARSTSGSHKSSSRDITPATHFSLDGDLKMSEREKRKLQQQERLFQQMDHDEEHRSKKGKRNSAGSSLNTPGVTSSRRLGHPEPSPTARHREHSHGVARKTSGSSARTNGRTAPKPKPVYKEASTQTDDDISTTTLAMKSREMKPPLSFKRRLLQQAQEDKLQRERMRSTSVKMESKSPALKDVSSSKPSPLPPSPPQDEPSTMDLSAGPTVDDTPREPTPAKEPTPTPTIDTEMGDVDNPAPSVTEPKVEEMSDAPIIDASENSDPTTHPPAPPWPPSAPVADEVAKKPDADAETPTKQEPTDNPATQPLTNPSNALNSVAGSTAAQSPGSVATASPLSPAVANVINPTPARKKLSLSDYTSRRAKLAQSHSTGTPPLAQSQSISSPTLSTASLPTNNSPPPQSAEGNLPAVTETENETANATAPAAEATSTST